MQAQDMSNEQQNVAVPLRAHTIFGVCEAIGEDFGFNPVWLRVPFAATVLLSPTMAIAAYLALGVLILASRLLFPNAKASRVEQTAEQTVAPANEQRELAEAA